MADISPEEWDLRLDDHPSLWTWKCDYCLVETTEPYFDEGDMTECPDCYDRNEAKEQYQMYGLDVCLCPECLETGWAGLPHFRIIRGVNACLD